MSDLGREAPGAGKRAGGAEDRDHHHLPDAPSIAPETGDGDGDPLRPDTDAALAFLDLWFGDEPRVLTAIPPDRVPTVTASFARTERERMAAWIDARQGKANLYFAVNRVFGLIASKAKKLDMASAVALHVDVDPRPGEPLEAERERAARVLREYDPPPSVMLDSGGGYQGFWLLDAPYALEGERADDDRHLPVEDRNRAIEVALGGDNCHNIDRIMRLPGTVNVPGEKKRKKGRRPALARVVMEDWSRRYRLEDFPGLPKVGVKETVYAAPEAGVSLDDLPDTVSDRTRMLIANGNDPDRPYASRSEPVFAVVCDLCRAGVSDGVILGLITDLELPISAHVNENGGLTYARRQLERAKEAVNDSFECDKDGRPLNNSQRNIRLAIRKLGAAVRLDEFAGRELVDGLDGFGPMLDEAAATELWLKTDARFGFRPGKDFYQAVLSNTAQHNRFHPVRDYLAGLTWDGVERIGRFLPVYAGAEDTAYVGAVGRLALLAAVRRVRRPGVKFDEMLVLESEQGKDKSTALKVLAVRDDWFSDDLPLNATTQRVIEAISGKWIVEAGELKGMRKGDVAHLKGFLSRTHDNARLYYDRRATEFPRQCVIVGTTNDAQYLRDTTGNRRFWPVAVKRFDIDALRRDRDQIWAEAAAVEARGEPIRLDPALWDAAAEAQDRRRVEDPFYESLLAVLGTDAEGKLKAEDAWRIVGKPKGMRSQDDNERLGAAIRRLGFEPGQRRFGRGPEAAYVRGDGAKRLALETDPNGEVVGLILTDGRDPEPFERGG